MRYLSIGLVGLAIFITGCVASSATSDTNNYRKRIGTAAPNDVVRETEQTLVSRYGYRFDRKVTTSEDMRFITQWNQHSPMMDEQAKNVSACRTRIRVSARPKNRSGAEIRTYTVIMEADYQVQKQGSPEWITMAMPESRVEYVDEIADRLEQQVAGGVRSY